MGCVGFVNSVVMIIILFTWWLCSLVYWICGVVCFDVAFVVLRGGFVDAFVVSLVGWFWVGLVGLVGCGDLVLPGV